MIFNERLKELRTEKGLTQVQAAEAISIAYRNYQRLEADGNLPNFSNFVAIADLFEVSLDYLAGRTDVREVNDGALPAPEHQIMLEAEVEVPEGTEDLLRRVISAALAAEGVDLPCEINVLLTDDEGIHQVNREMRSSRGRNRRRGTRTRRAAWSPWGTCASPWSGRRPRPGSSATAWSGS